MCYNMNGIFCNFVQLRLEYFTYEEMAENNRFNCIVSYRNI